MADYKLFEHGVIRMADGAEITEGPNNPHWRKYEAWLAKGNTPEPADPIPAPPRPEDTRLTLEDAERLFRGSHTPAQIAAAKRDRGKPIP